MNGQTVSNLIRSKTDIVDIIGERIPLVKKGKNFFGICPFHDDTNPSMSVSREKQIYTCFTCHATGNVFKFLMDYEKMSFPEALKYLGDRVGVDTNSVRLKKVNNNNDKYYEMYDFATKYYQNNILSPAGSMARTYLSKRGIDKDIIKKFEIGLSLPNNADLTELLLKKKYDIVDLNKAGLTNSNYDVYKDRIMFPLFDINGKVVGFSGRIYKDSQDNKYLNTKETPIFVKGEQLYNYHIAKEKARILKYVIIMEGFMDVIRASTIGYENVIALMGTALTHEQMKLIKRLSNNIILCLDGDNPGKAAAYKLGEEFLKEKIEVEENGKNAIENAVIKAKAYNEKTGMITIGMDNNLFFEDFPDEKQPGVFVRRVNGKSLSDEEMIEYYSKLAHDNGGKIVATWVYGIAICNGNKEKTFKYKKNHFYIIDTPSNKRNPGYPLDSISILPELNKYFVDLTKEEKEKNKNDKSKQEIIDYMVTSIKEIR